MGSVPLLLVSLLWGWAPAPAEATFRPSPADSTGLRDGTAQPQQQAVVVYLVRHAEKIDDSRDPGLSAAGELRAGLLADVLRDAGITAIWSTDYQRTRGTAAPLARRLGLEVRSYDPGDLGRFARQLLATPGRHLVVGHSNTTPELARALGGNPHGAIAETEYDRLYSITVGRETVTTALMRYGEPFRP